MTHRLASRLGALALALFAALPVRAALFEDEDARKAILDLRGKVSQGDEQRNQLAATVKQLSEQIQQLQVCLVW